MIIKNHSGIYGIIIKNNAILLITKSRGPYQRLLDLPGGKPEANETHRETLIREVQEETGVGVKAAVFFAEYHIQVRDDVSNCILDHHGTLYTVTDFDNSTFISNITMHDVAGAAWYPLSSIKQEKLSPFASKAIEEHLL